MKPYFPCHCCTSAHLPQTGILKSLLVLLMCLSACAAARHTSSTHRLAMRSEEIAIQLDLAESYLRGGKNRLALAKLLQIKEAAPKSPRVFFDLGHVYSLMGDFSKAKTNFEQAVLLEPHFGDAWNYLGQVCAALDDYEAAKNAYAKALAIPQYLSKEFPAYNMADLFVRQGDLSQAETYAVLAVNTNWRYIPAYLLLGTILVDQGRIQDAQKWYEQGAESDLNNTAIMLALGENLIRLKRLPQARQWFKRVIQTAPLCQDALIANTYLESIR